MCREAAVCLSSLDTVCRHSSTSADFPWTWGLQGRSQKALLRFRFS